MPETAQTQKFTQFAFFANDVPESLPEYMFRGWCHKPDDNMEQLTVMALRFWMRQRGGSDGVKSVHCYRLDDGTERYPNGNPTKVAYTEFFIHHD